MATPSHKRLHSYAHSASPSHLSSPPPPRLPSTPVPPLPHSSSTMSLSLPRFYPYYESMNTHFSSMIDLSSQLGRGPPVDPRQARRHGTDFDFSRSAANTPLPLSLLSTDSLVLPVVNESARSLNLSTTSGSVFSSSESNSDTSSVQDVQFDFPEPPSISPLLRRMRSSPLFTKDDVSLVQLGERALHTAVLSFTGKQSPHPFSDIPSDSTLSPLTDTAPDAIPQELDLDYQPEYQFTLKPTNWLSRPPASLPVPSCSDYIASDDDRFNGPPSLCYSSRFTTTPSATCPPLPRKVSKMRSLTFSPSIESLDARAEKRKIHKSVVRGRSASMDVRKSYSMSFFCSPEAVVRPQRLQSPIMSNRTPQRATSVTSPVGRIKASPLISGALHHLTSKPLVRQTNSNTGYGMSDPNREEFKSFMDISPERRLGTRKGAVKKLWARTSTIFEWGRLKRSGKQ